jgi:predicted PurR-regulated permease PerM
MAFFNRNWLYLLGGFVLLTLMWYFSDIVTYLLLAWVMSLLGQPLMRFFTQRVHIGKYKIGNSGAALLTIATFYAILAGVILIFVPTLVHQANNLANLDYQALGLKLQGPFSWLDHQAHQTGILHEGESLATKVQESLLSWFRPSLVSDIVGVVFSAAGNVVVVLSSVSFILFFFLEEKGLFASIIHAVVPTRSEPKVLEAMDESSIALTSYFKGLLTQLVSFSLMTTTFLWILGVPNALLIGLAGGLLNIVPYVGPIIGLVFGWFITLSSGLSLELNELGFLLLKVAGAFLTAQAIDNLFLSTLIFSKSVKAHPLEIFIVTLIAAKIGGVAGMVVGIPVYTVIRVIARIFFSQFKLVQRLTEHLDDEAEKSLESY